MFNGLQFPPLQAAALTMKGDVMKRFLFLLLMAVDLIIIYIFICRPDIIVGGLK